MQLRADALRFVLAQGLPAVIEVTGGSMAPTIAKGTKVHVAGLGEGAALAPGDVVLLATSTDVLLLHRVMVAFEERGARFVVHQGDALSSTFGIAARGDVLARMTSFAAEGGAPAPARAPRRGRARALRATSPRLRGLRRRAAPRARAAPQRQRDCASMWARLSEARARSSSAEQVVHKVSTGIVK